MRETFGRAKVRGQETREQKSNMFEQFQKFIGTESPPNRFWPVSAQDVNAAESQIGYAFPSQLKVFFAEVGCGFYAQGIEDSRRKNCVNGILGPDEIADLLINPECELRPYEGFPAGAMPFFDLGNSSYLLLFPNSPTPNAVYRSNGSTCVSNSLREFYDHLFEHAEFYLSV